ncbi:hypothetical protein L210DRAFT_3628069 [Boletus edulis BED1]|uniref:Uncharacterized protein n=1 Tax=Boletus edulis BED1 TaxID=1328754 RepID=A0AAD4C3X2_BOLED|nr:hypothetical protein L210DRAFT_3628069 [Boletus edulis BED1]
MSSSSVLLPSCSTYASISQPRLQSLYSDISRQKHSNPTSYHAHVDWWQRTLEELVSRGWQTETTHPQNGKETDAQDVEPENQSNKLVFCARRAVVDRLRYDGVGKPLGLASTIAELQRNRALVTLSQFMTSQQSVYDPGWLPYRIASFPLWWAMEQLDILRDVEEGRGRVVKFMTDEHDREVTAIDRGILELKTAVANLQDQVDRLHGKYYQARFGGLATTAKVNCTRAPSLQEELGGGVDQVTGYATESGIDLDERRDSSGRYRGKGGILLIMKTYEKSTATLQAILSHPSLRREEIDETMGALAAANANAREVDETIRIGGDIAAAETGVVDDAELEDELNELVKEAEREKVEADGRTAVDRLSEVKVPTETPGSRVADEVSPQCIAA